MPDAKNPPNGANSDAKRLKTTVCIWKLDNEIVNKPPTEKNGCGTKIAGIVQLLNENGAIVMKLFSQTRLGNIWKKCEKRSEKKMELKKPPMNPSHVLFGESSMSLVLPKSFPKMYAKISLTMTRRAGKMNQTMPLYKLTTMRDVCATTITIVRCVHPKSRN